jgi:F-box domain
MHLNLYGNFMKYLSQISSHLIHPFSSTLENNNINLSRLEQVISITMTVATAIFFNILTATIVFYTLTAFFKIKSIKVIHDKASSSSNGPPNLYNLPSELQKSIMGRIPVRDLHSLLLVNKDLSNLVKSTPLHKEIAELEKTTTSWLDYFVFTKYFSRSYANKITRTIAGIPLNFYSKKEIEAAGLRLSELDRLKYANYHIVIYNENKLAKKQGLHKLTDLFKHCDYEYESLDGLTINRNDLIPKGPDIEWRGSPFPTRRSRELIDEYNKKWRQLSEKYEVARIFFLRMPVYISPEKSYDWGLYGRDGVIVKEKNDKGTICYHLFIEQRDLDINEATTGWYYEKIANNSDTPENMGMIVNRYGDVVNQTLYDMFTGMLQSH